MWDAVEFWKKKMLEKNWENVSILEVFAKKKCIFRLLKVSVEALPRFYFHFFFDLWLAGKKKTKQNALHCPINTARPHRDYQTKKTKSLPCVEKIIYIFCKSFYYCDSLAYGVGVMWKISINGLRYVFQGRNPIPLLSIQPGVLLIEVINNRN